MGKFCTKCGTPVDEATGLCPKCTQQRVCNETENAPSSRFDTEKSKAENAVRVAEEKFKKKEEKKRAWAAAKKRYAQDVSAKKAIFKQAKKDKKKAKLAAMSTKQKLGRVLLKLLLVVLLLALLAGGGYLGFRALFPSANKGTSDGDAPAVTPPTNTEQSQNSGGSIGKHNAPTGDMPNQYAPSKTDADKFFEENSEIVSEIPAATAGRTEEQAYQNLTQRGFTAQPITAEYTMDGTYTEAQAISATGTDKHPIYSTFFVTTSGDLWVIFEINGAVFANPVSFNAERWNGAQIMLSETETITSYDSTLNKFYVTKPSEAALDVKVIARIDAATLDALTAWEVDGL